MNKKHLGFLIVFGLAVACVLTVFVDGMCADTAICILYSCVASFFTLIWGSVFSFKSLKSENISGVVLSSIIAIALVECLKSITI